MGTFNSKLDGEYLPSTPMKSTKVFPAPLDLDESIHNLTQEFTNFDIDIVDDFGADPRSPNVCRTPLNELGNIRQRITKNRDLISEITTPVKNEYTNNFMKEKLLKTLGLNLLDPRSPSQNIDRTPMVFKTVDKKSTAEINVIEFKSIDDQENEDFNETASTVVIENTIEDVEKVDECESSYLETNFEMSVKVETPKQKFDIDPRSPSIGIDRTPLVLEKDTTTVDNEKSISVELADSPKMIYRDNELSTDNTNKNVDETTEQLFNKQNDHFDKKSKRLSQIPKVPKVNKELCKLIYEDSENIMQLNITPKKVSDSLMGGNGKSRTPLGCVANKPHYRSKSNNDTNNKQKLSYAEIHNSNFDEKFIKNKIEIIATDENTPTSMNKRESKIPIYNRKMSN